MIFLANLFEKTDKRGLKFFHGHLGRVRVLIFPNVSQDEKRDWKWSLFLEQDTRVEEARAEVEDIAKVM